MQNDKNTQRSIIHYRVQISEKTMYTHFFRKGIPAFIAFVTAHTIISDVQFNKIFHIFFIASIKQSIDEIIFLEFVTLVAL